MLRCLISRNGSHCLTAVRDSAAAGALGRGEHRDAPGRLRRRGRADGCLSKDLSGLDASIQRGAGPRSHVPLLLGVGPLGNGLSR